MSNDPFQRPKTFCYKCDKKIFKTEGEAKAFASRKIKEGDVEHLYAYECPKGVGYHLTRSPKRSDKVPRQKKKVESLSTSSRKSGFIGRQRKADSFKHKAKGQSLNHRK
jgi:hypothetical protein